ncbi:AAA family ATPase [Candidatus Pelagibacter communis]|uniref:nSTAND3 domain-containing NTPase n=1 Tax=Pelagibacter ubique TaxID=198252 RepID=UPI00094CA71D|nr:AAA family ATPase [Candidatus Pelagibacter ubique]
MNLNPLTQINLFEHKEIFNQLYQLSKNNTLPNKIILSGEKGIGKSTLAYHLINFVLSENEEHPYDFENNKINPDNRSYKLMLNKSNPNFYLIDVLEEKKNIDINQIRELIINLNKSSFNNKKRFVLIDNIELLNLNSINALLKILEEPNENINFILINNNKRVLPTLKSRCLNFKVFLTKDQSIRIVNQLLNDDINTIINDKLFDYYATPGKLFKLIKLSQEYNLDLANIDLNTTLKTIIKDKIYKKDKSITEIIYSFIELYFRDNISSKNISLLKSYHYFLEKINNTKIYNLDEETLFMEFEDKILNG